MLIRSIKTVLLTSAACGCALFAFAGCHYEEAPIQARGDTYETPWLTMGSNELRGDTRIGQATQTVDEFNHLHVTIPIRNTINKQLYVESVVTFFGPTGAQVNSIQNTLTIPAQSIVNLEAASTGPTGGPQPFRVELRFPRVN